MKKKITREAVPTENFENRIFVIRDHRVILDSDLAKVYGVTTKRLNEQIRRNLGRFPEDFMFRLTVDEYEKLKSQFATLKQDTGARSQNATALNLRSQNATSRGHGGRRYLPYAFTEHGALMAANILNSERAVTMSIYVIRAFVRLREVFVVNQVLQDRLAEIEEVLFHHDGALEHLYRKIKPLLAPPKRTDAIGFEVVSPRPGKIS